MLETMEAHTRQALWLYTLFMDLGDCTKTIEFIGTRGLLRLRFTFPRTGAGLIVLTPLSVN